MPFRDLTGHRRLLELLARSIARDTLPPSLIFGGPSGVGKRRVATATAQALNCLAPLPVGPESDAGSKDPAYGRPPAGSKDPAYGLLPNLRPRLRPNACGLEIDACGTCAACTRIARGVHPDVLVVEPGDTGTIKVDQVRELIDATAYRPFEGRRRVVIIDEADALVVPAQHALLKTLEEPPSSSVFLLVTSRPDALLPTVQSRCPRLRFQPLTAGEVTSVLVAEGRPEQEARAVAAIADGSVGAALSASVDEFAAARETAMRVLTQTAAGPDASRRSAISQALAGPAGSNAIDRDGLATVIRAMSSLLRDVAALGTGATPEALANPDLAPALGRLTTYRGERGVRAFSTLDEALVALDRNASVKIVADWVTVQL